MNLILDIGNTRTKVSTFEDRSEISTWEFSDIRLSDLKDIYMKYPEITNCILSKVSDVNNELVNYCCSTFDQFIELDQSTPLPFRVEYETPHTLGRDRIAGVAGANELYPRNSVLIVDLGTAITFDLKTSTGVFIGGNISPGMQMRYKALNEFTAKLPRVHPSEQSRLLGNSTQSAIQSGVENGIVYEIERTIESLEQKYPGLVVLLTGGDAHFFDNLLKKTIFVVSNLVSVGLNSILNYNVGKN